MSQRVTPVLWKTAIIKPIPKRSKPTQPKDYRPIAITSCLSKLLEKLVKCYIVNNTSLDKYQFAYQPNRSTQDALLCLLTTITSFIDLKARSLFLDFSSAFNTISVNKLVSRLSHLDNNVVAWVRSFLSNRIQYTKVNNILSDMLITNTGTPQGTVLSPVLFSIYTDIIRSTCPQVTVLKYADDTVIVGCISDDADLRVYKSEISRICALCHDNDLLLNGQKTHEMCFSTKRNKPVVEPLNINGQDIAFSDSVRYLGVIIDTKLRFEEHVQATLAKARQRTYVVNRFFRLGASPSLVKQLFNSFMFIESFLLYCTVVFFSHLYDSDQKRLRTTHKLSKKWNFSALGFDAIIENKLKNYCLNIYLDEKHFIHDFLTKLPSGRLQTVRHRTTLGKNSAIRHFILLLNKTIFSSRS
jgi:hypothetical protein